MMAALLGLGVPLAGARAQLVVAVPPPTAAVASAATVATLAGEARLKGSADGPALAARFARPMGLAVDARGTVYVADADNMTVRAIAPLVGGVTTLAGAAGRKGYADGPGAQARFHHPVGLAVDAAGTVYVADADNHTIRKITPDGVVTTLAGLAGTKGSADGSGPAARFNCPHGIAVAADGTLYVADTFNHTIRRITPAGVVSTMAGTAGRKGRTDGPAATSRFRHPFGVAVDGQGTLYVADNGNHTIRRISAAGDVSTAAGLAGHSGSANGPGAAARFFFPTGLAVDAGGTLYIAEALNSVVRRMSGAGVVTTLAGTAFGVGPADGTGEQARFDGPSGVAVDAAGAVYVADSNSNTIRVIK